jgi:hypothetical protein
MHKKNWITPELIMLTRSDKNENVLCGCKMEYISMSENAGPLDYYNGCWSVQTAEACSSVCSDSAPS